MQRTLYRLLLILLLTHISVSALKTQPANAAGTIYIRADGSVDPPSSPIQRTVDTYTLTGSIIDSIVIERDHVTLDGARYNLTGAGGNGVTLSGRTNVTILNMEIQGFVHAVHLDGFSQHNSIVGNNIRALSSPGGIGYGIYLLGSPNNTIVGNNITNHFYGIYLLGSSGNSIIGNRISSEHPIIGPPVDWANVYLSMSSHNNISDNIMPHLQFSHLNLNIWDRSDSNVILRNNGGEVGWHGTDVNFTDSSGNLVCNNNFNAATCFNSTNFWNYDYPLGGNYWSGYPAPPDVRRGPGQNETGSDGIGDSPYAIGLNNQDKYPLMKPYPWASHDVGITSFTTSRTVVGQGFNASLTTMIFNYGIQTESCNLTINGETFPTINETGLVGYWKLDESSGVVAHDSSGNANHGFLVNGPTWTKGKYGNALSLDGTDDYVDCLGAPSLDITVAITIEAWIYKKSNLAHGGAVLGKWKPGGQSSYVLYGQGDSDSGFHLMHPDSSQSNLTNYSIPLDVWTHYVATYDGSTMKVFLNGKVVKETTTSGSIAVSNALVWIGNDGYNQHFNGMIDNVMLYNRTLGEVEITAHYACYAAGAQETSLASRDYVALALSWNTAYLPKGNYTLISTVATVPGEMDVKDNARSTWIVVTIPGDVNGDFTVDIYDAILLAGAYNSVPTSTNWNANADINGDNLVDLYDAIILSNHFNQHYP